MDRPERMDEAAGVRADGKSILPLILRAARAAEVCSTSARTWRTWGTMGKIPRPIYIGRIPFWRYDELQAWVAAGCPERTTWDAMRE